MKTRNLLLIVGAFLLNVSAWAQNGPTRTEQDSKIVFEQDFEGDWETWSSFEVDTIDGIFYYINGTTSQYPVTVSRPWNNAEWKNGFIRRDTLIHLYNGVVQTDSKRDINSAAYREDLYTMVDDGGIDVERNQAFSEYGIDGGKYYFRYSSGNGSKAENYSSGLVPEYRRNLFVHALPIEDETSYRLTVYVKTTKLGGTTPTFRADVMRGNPYASEKPFTMGLENNSRDYKYNTEFTYQKNDFEDGKWEKIVFMTYYLNDSIADNYLLSNGFWWTENWKWHNAAIPAAVGKEGFDSLSFIRQPDKFFARLSFRSDSTIFEVDNLTLTKSWIAGIEHCDDMLRVDFGYKTNISELATTYRKRTKIPAIELPYQYYSVWGKDKSTKEWINIDIESAEYHEDGYMYMWAKPKVINNIEQTIKFDNYDSILVSFTNPDDPEIMLKYNGNKFPKALDVEWIKAGKKVPDFSNELSMPNPSITYNQFNEKVYNLKTIPPELWDCQYEDGSFNLDGAIRNMNFKFSKQVEYEENADESTNLAILGVYKNGIRVEAWFVSGYGEDNSTLIFERPAKYTTPLEGDYEFRLLQLKGNGTDYSNGGKPIVVNYSFGPPVAPAGLAAYVDFNHTATYEDFTTESCSLPGFSSSHCTTKVVEMGGLYEKALMFGLYGKNNGAENNANNCVKLFYEFSIAEAGDYEIIFGETGCNKGSYNDDSREIIYLYNADGEEEASLSRGSTGFMPTEGKAVNEIKIDTIAVSELAPGSYKIAFTMPNDASWGGIHKGGKILYFIQVSKQCATIDAKAIPASYPILNALKGAQANLNGLIAKANETAAYKGNTLNTAKAVASEYANFSDTKPSAYTQVTNSINATTAALQARIKTVDSLRVTAYEAGIKFLADNEGIAEWAEMKDLEAFLESVATLNYANYAPEYLREKIAYINTKMAKIKVKESAMRLAASQLNNLVELAADLGVVFPDAYKDKIASRVARAQLIDISDVQLVDIYKKAITAKLYSKIACGEIVDNLPLTAFIDNPGLFVISKVVDRHEKSMPANAGDLKIADENGAQIQLVNHQYNNIPICILILEQEFTDLLPGWTVKAPDTGYGNRMVTVDNYDYARLKAGESAFDGNLAMDWNSKAELKTSLAGLPTGFYTLGCALADNTGANTVLSAKAKMIIDEDNDKDSTYTKALAANDKNAVVDSIKVNYGTMDINLTLTSGNGWSKADNFYLIFKADKDFDYAGAANDADAYFKQALTFVNDIEEIDDTEPLYPDPTITETHRMYMDNVSGMAGNEIVIPIKMENTRYITAFSLDVKLPSGMTFVNASLNSGRNNGHSLYRNVTSINDGSVVSLACLSLNNSCLFGNDGTVVNLTVRLSNDMEGDYNIQLGNIEMTAEPTQKYTPATYTGCVSVQARFEPGDVNEDGSISITDAVGVVAFIINSQTQGLNRNAADANQDGTIDVADAVWIVNKIIRKSYSFAPARFSVSGEISSVLTMDDIMVADKMSIPVRIEGMPNEITALQFNLTLPENLSIKEVVTDQDHMIATQKQQDGSYMVICLSMNNATFIGNGNAALELKLVSDKLKAKGDVVLDNIIMVAPDGRKKECEAVTGRLTGGGETGIPDIDAGGNYDMYDIQGRTIDRANGIFIRNGKKLMQIK